jgi:hypothetical protein
VNTNSKGKIGNVVIALDRLFQHYVVKRSLKSIKNQLTKTLTHHGEEDQMKRWENLHLPLELLNLPELAGPFVGNNLSTTSLVPENVPAKPARWSATQQQGRIQS